MTSAVSFVFNTSSNVSAFKYFTYWPLGNSSHHFSGGGGGGGVDSGVPSTTDFIYSTKSLS